LFELFYFARMYPTASQCAFLFGNNVHYNRLLRRFSDQAAFLNSRTNTISYWHRRRFCFENMLPHLFSVFTTTCVDTIPIQVRKPEDSAHRSHLYSGKTKSCILKFQVGCMHLGFITSFSGPYSGLEYDGHIYDRVFDAKSLGLWVGIDQDNPEHSRRWEMCVGDNHYMASLQVACPIRKTARVPFTELETAYNNYFGNVRSTIEQVFGYLKEWAILGTVYRGKLYREVGFSMLVNMFHLVCELYNTRFMVLGTFKRNVTVICRDANGTPAMPPHDMTPENLRIRLNLHYQLTEFNEIISPVFRRQEDIYSGCSIITFLKNDLVWFFYEKTQKFVKCTVSGVVGQQYSLRSTDKQTIYSDVPPNVVFFRDSKVEHPPNISLFTIPAGASPSYRPRSAFHTGVYSRQDDPYFYYDHPDDIRDPIICYSKVNASKTNFHEPVVGCSPSSSANHAEGENANLLILAPDPENKQEGNISDNEEDSDLDDGPCIPHSVVPRTVWEYFRSLPQLHTVLEEEGVTLNAAQCYLLCPGQWLNDELINFFCNSFMRSCREQSTNQQISFHISNSYFFSQLTRQNMYGEIQRYDYKGVHRYFVAQRIPVWNLDKFIVPVNINHSHWLLIVVYRIFRRIEVLDSNYNPCGNLESASAVEADCIRYGEYVRKWYQTKLQNIKSEFSDLKSPFYIENSIHRQLQINQISATLNNLEVWPVQVGSSIIQRNGNDCGVCLILNVVNVITEKQNQSIEWKENCLENMRKYLANYIRYRILRNKPENIDPFKIIKSVNY